MFAPGQSVYVIAARTTSRVDWTLGDRFFREAGSLHCGTAMPRDPAGGNLPTVGSPETLERSDLDRGPIVTTDQKLRERIESEIGNGKVF